MGEGPLDLADPDRDPGKLGGIGVDLDPQDALGADHGEGPWQAQGLRLQDHLVLQVLEPEQGEHEEVARAAGRVQDPKARQPVEEAL